MKRFFLIFILFFALESQAYSIDLPIAITGLRSTKGKICLAIFTDEVQFRKEQPQKSYFYDKSGLIDNEIDMSICDLKPGIYGIAVLDDENENGKLDYKIFIPCEGIGFSCFDIKLRKPGFSDFSFYLKDDFEGTIIIKIKYFL